MLGGVIAGRLGNPFTNWSVEDFVKRFCAGGLIPGSPMPWGVFAHMTDEELRAIYLYLRSLSPVPNDTGATVRPASG